MGSSCCSGLLFFFFLNQCCKIQLNSLTQTCTCKMLLNSRISSKDKTHFSTNGSCVELRNLSRSCGRKHSIKTTLLPCNDGHICMGLSVQRTTSSNPKVARCGYGSGLCHIVKGPIAAVSLSLFT